MKICLKQHNLPPPYTTVTDNHTPVSRGSGIIRDRTKYHQVKASSSGHPPCQQVITLNLHVVCDNSGIHLTPWWVTSPGLQHAQAHIPEYTQP